jgi:membrane protein
MRARSAWEIVKATFADWQEDEAPRLAASLAYYAIFSLAPLLIIVVAVVSFVYRGDTVDQIEAHLTSLMGADAARMVSRTIAQTNTTGEGLAATVIGIAAVLLGATGVFAELHTAMNKIWEVPASSAPSWLAWMRERTLSFAMVLAVACLLVLSLALSTFISAASQYFSYMLPGAAFVWYVVDLVVSLSIITFLFAILFRYVPDIRVAWRDVWAGALATAVLFVIGKFLLGLYLGRSSVGSAFGAAGSILVILAWIYYSAQILFLGAEFTQVYASRYGSRIASGYGDSRRTA